MGWWDQLSAFFQSSVQVWQLCLVAVFMFLGFRSTEKRLDALIGTLAQIGDTLELDKDADMGN